jgi:hypothetical protein
MEMIMRIPRPAGGRSLALACLALAACATDPAPTVSTTWRDPAYSGPPMRKVFVVGLDSQSLVDQRVFENVLVSALQNAGVAAVPGWQFVPTDRVPDQATMRGAILASGADGALLVRMGTPTTETALTYSPAVIAQTGPDLYAGWYAPGVSSVDYQAATIYTTLFSVATARAVWTYNPPTYGPLTLQQGMPAFAADVVGRLQDAGLIGSR